MKVNAKTTEKTARESIPAYERDQISRGVLACLRTYPNLPPGVKQIAFEFLEEDKPCMALSTIQGTYIIKRYMGGDYMAEYPFKIIYRGQPTDDGGRLKMCESLDAVGEWLKRQKPDIGSGKQVQRIVINSPASLFGRYENRDEDYQILMTMTYYSERSKT